MLVSGVPRLGWLDGPWRRFHAARVLILMRLWAKTPWPHQVRSPSMPVSSVRFQP